MSTGLKKKQNDKAIKAYGKIYESIWALVIFFTSLSELY